MKIQFIESVAGERFAYYPGETHELDDKIARAFVRTGKAVEIVPAEVPVSAIAATVRRQRRRGARVIETASSGAAESR